MPKVRFIRDADWIFTNAFLSPTPEELGTLAFALQRFEASIADALVSLGRAAKSKEMLINAALQKIEVERIAKKYNQRLRL
jgi:hypothetical protein